MDFYKTSLSSFPTYPIFPLFKKTNALATATATAIATATAKKLAKSQDTKMNNSLSIECHLAFLEAVHKIVQDQRDEWADEELESGNYILKYIREIGYDATYSIPAELFSDADLDGYFHLWLSYVQKYKELELKYTTTRDKSLFTMFEENLWNGSVQQFRRTSLVSPKNSLSLIWSSRIHKAST